MEGDKKEGCCAPTQSGGGYRFTPCRKTAKVVRDGKWYCGIHDPEAIKARREKRHKAWVAEHTRKDAAYVAQIEQRARASAKARVFDDLLFALKTVKSSIPIDQTVVVMSHYQNGHPRPYVYQIVDDAIAKAEEALK